MFTLKYLVQLIALVCIMIFAIRGDYWIAVMTFIASVCLDHLIDLEMFKRERGNRK